MATLADALKGALREDSALEARELPDPEPPEDQPTLPDPHGSAWLELLSTHTRVPADAKTARLRQLTDVTVKQLKGRGQKRDARELARARDAWLRDAERKVWGLVKARMAELELSDKAYRALKQDKGADPERIWARLNTRRAEEQRGAGTARVKAWLLGG